MLSIFRCASRSLILGLGLLVFSSFTLIELLVVVFIQALSIQCDQPLIAYVLVKDSFVNIQNGTTTLSGNLLLYEIDPVTQQNRQLIVSAPPQTMTLVSTEPMRLPTIGNYYLFIYSLAPELRSNLQEGKYYKVVPSFAAPLSLLASQLAQNTQSTPQNSSLQSAYYFEYRFIYIECSKLFADCNGCDDSQSPCNPTLNLFDNFANGKFEGNTPQKGGFQQSLASYEKTNDVSVFVPDANYQSTGSFLKVQHSFPFVAPKTVAAGTSVNVAAWIKVDPSAYSGEGGGNVIENFNYDIGIVRPEGLEVEQGWVIDGSRNFRKWQPFQVKFTNAGTADVVLYKLIFTSSASVKLSFSQSQPPTSQGEWAADFFLDDLTVSCTEAPFVPHALNLNADFKTTAPARTIPRRNQFIPGHTEYVDLGVHSDYMSAFPYYCQPLIGTTKDDPVLRHEICNPREVGAPTLVCEDFVLEFDLKVKGKYSDFPATGFNGRYLEPVVYREPILSRQSADGTMGWKFSVIKTDMIGFPNKGELGLEFSWTFDETYDFHTQGSGFSCIARMTDRLVIIENLGSIDQNTEAMWVRVKLRIEALDTDYPGDHNTAVKGKNKINLTITPLTPLVSAGVAKTQVRLLPDDIAKDVVMGNSTVSRMLCGNSVDSGQWPPHCCDNSNCNLRLTEVGQYPLIIGNNNPSIASSPQFDIKNLKMIKGTELVLDMPFNQVNGAISLDYSKTGAFGRLMNYSTQRSIGGAAWRIVD
jgi:hypothetical protein